MNYERPSDDELAKKYGANDTEEEIWERTRKIAKDLSSEKIIRQKEKIAELRKKLEAKDAEINEYKERDSKYYSASIRIEKRRIQQVRKGLTEVGRAIKPLFACVIYGLVAGGMLWILINYRNWSELTIAVDGIGILTSVQNIMPLFTMLFLLMVFCSIYSLRQTLNEWG